MGIVNNLFSTSPTISDKLNPVGTADGNTQPVKLEFTPTSLGITRQKNNQFPPERNLSETEIENALLQKLGFDSDNPQELARAKELLKTDQNPFDFLKTSGILTATYNRQSGKYEISGTVDKNVYLQLQGKAEEIKTIVAQKAQPLPSNPNEIIAAKNGIANNKRDELEKQLREKQKPSASVSAPNLNESEKTVKSIAETIESVTGTNDALTQNEIGKQFNRLSISALRLGGRAMDWSNYLNETINGAVRYVAPDSIDELLDKSDKVSRENAQALKTTSSSVTRQDTEDDLRNAANGKKPNLIDDLANKAMYFPEGIPNAVDSAIKGDFKADDGSYSDKVGKIIGGLNPVGDVRDIVANTKNVVEGKKGSGVALGASIIGAIPGGGDVAKPIIKEVTEELTEKAVKDVGTETIEKTAKEEAEKLTKQAEGVFPRGFENVEQFNKAVFDIRSSLKVDDATIGVRGSSVTGVKFKSGESFDASSDIDFFIVSDKLYAQGIEKGARGSNGAFKVGATRKYFPEIHETENSLSEQLSRKVTIRIFSKEGFEAVKAGQEILVR